jgi:hypothetical protein
MATRRSRSLRRGSVAGTSSWLVRPCAASRLLYIVKPKAVLVSVHGVRPFATVRATASQVSAAGRHASGAVPRGPSSTSTMMVAA